MKKPEVAKHFYDTLSSVLNKTKKREATIIGGDFNAKTRTKDQPRNNITGKYAKSSINTNGEKLIELCTIQNLRITNTNTFFKHRPIHQNTWQSPAPYAKIRLMQKRKLLEKIRIETKSTYILGRNNNNNTRVIDCKVHITNVTKSDHKPVIAKIVIQWKKQSPNKSLVASRFLLHHTRWDPLPAGKKCTW